MVKESAFDELLEQVIQEEGEGTFPAWQKRRGLRLPGLSGAMLNESMVASDVAQYLHLSDRAIRHYQRGTRGVKSIAVATRIASIVGCPLSEITTYEELARYHSPCNSVANRRVFSVSSEGTTSQPHHVNRWRMKARGVLSRILG